MDEDDAQGYWWAYRDGRKFYYNSEGKKVAASRVPTGVLPHVKERFIDWEYEAMKERFETFSVKEEKLKERLKKLRNKVKEAKSSKEEIRKKLEEMKDREPPYHGPPYTRDPRKSNGKEEEDIPQRPPPKRRAPKAPPRPRTYYEVPPQQPPPFQFPNTTQTPISLLAQYNLNTREEYRKWINYNHPDKAKLHDVVDNLTFTKVMMEGKTMGWTKADVTFQPETSPL